MLKALLKLFPAAFRQTLGEEWLLDTREEWTQARRAGFWASLACVGRTLGGVVQGAWTAHAHARSQRKARWVLAGGPTVEADASTKASSGLMFAWLSGVGGAALIGHVGMQMFLSLWMEPRGEAIVEAARQGKVVFALLGAAPMLLGVAVMVLGVRLCRGALRHHTLPGARLSFLGTLGLFVFLAASAQHSFWALLGLGEMATESAEVFEEYPKVRTAMGLSDQEGSALVGLAPTTPECRQATTVLSLTSSRWTSGARASGEVIPLMLLKSMATGLFSSGCWTQGQLFEYHATLMQAAEVSPRQVRKISLQTYGVHNAQEQRKMRVMLDISRASWCETLALQALGDGADHDRVRSTCSRIEQPGVSVHAAGAHRPTSVQLAEMASH